MSLKNSPHVELMRIMLKHGPKWDEVKNTRYVKERVHRYNIGMLRWTKEYIKHHVLEKRYGILKSLRKYGYDTERHGSRPVKLVEEPFWMTRFLYTADWLKGIEEVDGGGRCSAAYALGWKTIPAIMCVDRAPGTKQKGKFEQKLKNITGVWEHGNQPE